MRKFIRQADQLWTGVEKSLAAGLLGTLTIVALVQIIARNLFSHNFAGLDPLIRHSVIWIGFLGASLAAKEGRHIRIDAAVRLLPERWRHYLEGATLLLASGICIVLFWASLGFVGIEREFGDRLPVSDIPIWTLELIFPYVFAIIFLRFFCYGIAQFISKESPPTEDPA